MYYYTSDISIAILDLDPDLFEIFLFFVTLSILHIQTYMIPLRKAVLKGIISFSYTYELQAIYGDVMTPKLKRQTFFLVTESFLQVESCVMSL